MLENGTILAALMCYMLNVLDVNFDYIMAINLNRVLAFGRKF